MTHYIIVILIIAVIVVIQLYSFFSNLRKMSVFKTIFSKRSANQIFWTIDESIMKYVKANKGGVCDFHIMKDIVDRNCDAKEEEIQTQIPIPLYLGLVGTMAGILVGIMYLWLSGGLSDLLDANGNKSGAGGVEGVEALLGGVALAMISSICGIVLTTVGSSLFKYYKNVLEQSKHSYLSELQTDILPTLSSDVQGALVKMSQNLNKFNEEFTANCSLFEETLQRVHESAQDNVDILNAMKRLKITEVVSANIQIYDKLKNCTDEIGKLGDYLKEINKYQANTTEAINKLNTFFNKGIETIDEINLGVKDALERFKTNTKTYLKELEEKLNSQILDIDSAAKKQQEALASALKTQSDELVKHFATVTAHIGTAAEKQQEIFAQKLTNLNTLVIELQNLSAVKNSLTELVRQSGIQSQQVAQLTRTIQELAEIKTGGSVQTRMPQWLVLIIIVSGGLVSITCLAFLVPKIIELFNSI